MLAAIQYLCKTKSLQRSQIKTTSRLCIAVDLSMHLYMYGHYKYICVLFFFCFARVKNELLTGLDLFSLSLNIY
jgi:hypothetical protein